MKKRDIILEVAVLLLAASILMPIEASAKISVVIRPPAIVIDSAPFVAVIPGTYVYFAPDIEADILFYQGHWYRPYSGRWYWAKSYNGPWVHIQHNRVPKPLLSLPGDYRHGVIHDRIQYDHLHKNWKNWERDRHWHKHYGWEERRHDRQELRDDRREMRHDREERRHDRQ